MTPQENLTRARDHFQLGDYEEVQKSCWDCIAVSDQQAEHKNLVGEAYFLLFRAKAELCSSAPASEKDRQIREAYEAYMKAVDFNPQLQLFDHKKLLPVSLLGVGGTSYIFLVRLADPYGTLGDAALGILALKAIKKEFDQGNRELRRELYRDIRKLQTLKNLNIINVYLEKGVDEASFMSSPYLYILQDAFDGKTLHEVSEKIRARAITEDEVAAQYRRTAHIMTEVCEGVATAHAQGIFHGDLKPENILVDLDRLQTKVTDFGLVNFLEHASQRDSRRLLGTPQYMCPERYKNLKLEDPQKCDIYALGVILWEMLAGSQAFQAHQKSVFESNPGLDMHIKLIIELCTNPDPDFRYESALEVKRDLVGFLRKLEKSDFAQPDPYLALRFLRHFLVVIANLFGIPMNLPSQEQESAAVKAHTPTGSFVAADDLRVSMTTYRYAWLVPLMISSVYIAKLMGYPLIDDKLMWVRGWLGCGNDELYLATFLVGPFAWLAYLYYSKLLVFADPKMHPLASFWLELQLFVYVFPMLLGYICPDLWAVSSGIGILFVSLNNFSLWLYLRHWPKYYRNVASELRAHSTRRMSQWAIGTLGGGVLLIAFGIMWYYLRKKYVDLPLEYDYVIASLVLLFGIGRSIVVNVLGGEVRDMRDTFVVERRLREKHQSKLALVPIRRPSGSI